MNVSEAKSENCGDIFCPYHAHLTKTERKHKLVKLTAAAERMPLLNQLEPRAVPAGFLHVIVRQRRFPLGGERRQVLPPSPLQSTAPLPVGSSHFMKEQWKIQDNYPPHVRNSVPEER